MMDKLSLLGQYRLARDESILAMLLTPPALCQPSADLRKAAHLTC
jgi:hypothetical protein